MGLYGTDVSARGVVAGVTRSPSVEAPLPPAWRVVRALAIIAALALLAAVLAHWIWHWVAPAPTAVAPPAISESPAAAINAAALFGAPASGPVASTASGPTDARLLGVIAGREGTGYALFRLPDRGAVLVAVGQELRPGVTLRAVTISGARLSDNGTERDVPLRAATGPQVTAAATSANRVAPAASAANARNTAACRPPGASDQPPYRLNAELLSGIAAKPETWSDAFTITSDGISMREGNAFGTMLGLRPGDRVTQANGVALRGAEDVLIAVIRPLLANQAVRVTGLRDGRFAEWIYVNAGACPP